MRDPHPQLVSLWLKHTQDSPQRVGFLEGVRAMYLASKNLPIPQGLDSSGHLHPLCREHLWYPASLDLLSPRQDLSQEMLLILTQLYSQLEERGLWEFFLIHPEPHALP